MTATAHGRLSPEALEVLVRDGEIDTVLVAVADLQGRLQGKRLDARHFCEDAMHGSVEGCGYLLATDVEMEPADGFELTSWARGYGDLVLRPDVATIRRVPWHDRTAIVSCDALHHDGTEVVVAPRQVLRSQAARLAARGWTGLAGTELEFIVFRDTYEEAWDRRYHGLTAANQYNVDYSLLGTSRVEPLLGRLRRSMRDAGMVVESAKGECNLGQHEIAFKYAELVDKADEHCLFKLGAKEIAAQEGCSLTFMAKYNHREGNSCHVHLSLRDEAGDPVFAGHGQHGFSATFEHFLAGMVAHTRALSLLLAPNVNSYKRYVAGTFAPTALVWGIDNRTCAFRVVGTGSSLRVETRVPGGDVNPYLAIAALVAAGLRGVADEAALPAPFVGDAHHADAPRMPQHLGEAIELFDRSDVAREAFGGDVVAHYVHAARLELAAYQAAVTDWERVRGFERL